MSKRRLLLAAFAAVSIAATVPALAADNPMVGGAAMYDNKTIVENAANSKDHTTLVAAVKAAGLAETLSGKQITLTDENGTTAFVTIADVKQSNGVIHVIDTVLLPKK